MHRVLRRGWEALSENPRQNREAQDQGGIRVAFLLDTFLWPRKEKYPARRCGNRHSKNIRRDSDTSTKHTINMQIWVDADACPKAIKDILFRAAERCQVTTTLVANQTLPVPPSRYIRMRRVSGGFDVADNEIVQRMAAGDLVVTSDIPLAAEAIAKGGYVIDTRGESYSRENIGERLAMRDFMDGLRASGIDTGGPATLSSRDVQHFANQLDRFLTRHAGKG